MIFEIKIYSTASELDLIDYCVEYHLIYSQKRFKGDYADTQDSKKRWNQEMGFVGLLVPN